MNQVGPAKGTKPVSESRWRFSMPKVAVVMLVIASFGLTAAPSAMGAVAIQPDGKVVVARGNQVLRYLPDGKLDPSFSGDGIEKIVNNPRPLRQTFSGGRPVIQPDGKIAVAGVLSDCGGSDDPFLCSDSGVVARLNPEGGLDPSFGGGDGIAFVIDISRTRFGGSLGDLALQGDGKLLVSGSQSGCSSSGGTCPAVVVRLNSDGSRDQGFGNGGTASMPSSTQSEVFSALALQPDGKIVAAGGVPNPPIQHAIIARLNPDGSLDGGFGGGDGVVEANLPLEDVALVPDGKIVAAGTQRIGANTRPGFYLARFTVDGNLDPSFGGGVVFTPLGDDYVTGLSLGVQADGKALLAGPDVEREENAYRGRLALLRFAADGLLDPAFGGGDGVTITDLPPPGTGWGFNPSLALADGRIVVDGAGGFGAPSRGSQPTVVVAAYDLAGSLDPGFGGDGITFTPPPSRCFGRYGPDISAASPNGQRITGTGDSELLIGSPDDDVIVGLGGSDTILGKGGNDLICPGPGDDQVRGGDGDDRVAGGGGGDVIVGGRGKDRLLGNVGRDRLFGGPGADRLFGGDGNDILGGGPGRDRLVGGAGRDQVRP